MTTAAFATATNVDEALAALAGGARPVAGGTDLVVGARQGKTPLPGSLVAIHRIGELRGVVETNGGLRFGALATHDEIVAHPSVRERFTALADASAIVGSHATRAQGTLGGNLMNASPAMETGGPLICLGGSVVLRSTSGERTIPVADLFEGPGATVAAADELLVAVDVPAPTSGTGSAYVRLEYRRQMEIAVVGATAVVTVEGSTVSDAKVAITALAPTIRRIPEAEAALRGGSGDAAAVDAAAAAVSEGSAPISDVRASERYRRAMAAVIAGRAITIALERARGGDVPIPASSAPA
jgi:CO/xanthine dehydrogenase FAD-binding subunit